ncbi:MAG: nitrate- and nitrite sensing domain-containing protein [Chitinophagaceae bacterium]|nr:nitrate- and nitrite sensing domain-containing protein [Chitinophagaceae bacterium]
MIAFFKRIPLGVKLLLISVIPLLFIVFLAYQLHHEKQKQVNIVVAIIEKIKRNGNIILLIESLQAERKLSFDHVMHRNGEIALSTQRTYTDSVLNLLYQSKDPQIMEFDKYTKLGALDSIRNRISNNEIETDAVTNYYSSMIFRLNTFTALSLPVNPVLRPLYNDLQAQRLLSEMITYLSIIRPNIYSILYNRKYEVEILLGTAGAYEILKSYETEFFVKADINSIKQYERLNQNSDYSIMLNVLSKAFGSYKVDSTYSAEQFWEISENGLDEIALLQNQIWNKAVQHMEEIRKEQIRQKNLGLLLVIILMIIVISIVMFTILILSGMLREIKVAAEKLSMGLSGVRLKIWSNDVVGSLAESIQKIDENQNRLAKTADEIGKGNFNVDVQPRSKGDLLGNSILSMQASLQKFSEEMEALVKQRTKELERSNSDLQQFAHVASHDLKEPLRKIMVFSSILNNDIGDNLTQEHRAYIEKINHSAKRLTGMVDGVLNYSIINANDDEMKMIDLNDIMADVLSDLELYIEQKNVHVKLSKLPVIWGIPSLVHQLFYNLVNNALKFSGDNVQPEIIISSDIIATDKLPSGMKLNGVEDYAEIRVKDNGIGFNQQYADSLFNIFTRLNDKDKYEGTGLGLTLCKKIADRHHGGIFAEGKENEGACFRVLLPVKNENNIFAD